MTAKTSLLLCQAALYSACLLQAQSAQPFNAAKLEAFVNANIKATHAYESLNAKILGPELRAKYWNVGGLSDAELQKLVDLQQQMLAQPFDSIAAWARGEHSNFDDGKYVQGILNSRLSVADPRLPVNVWAAWFKSNAPQASSLHVKTLANLQQMMAEIYRDGDLLQDLYGIYAKLGLPVYFGQIGIKASTDSQFLVFGREIYSKMCASPYEEDPLILQMMFRKMYNWGRRYSGERDRSTIAKELLKDPSLAEAIRRAKLLPPRKIAIVGHSYTMDVHWATAASFVPIVREMMRELNPSIEFKYFQQGGMDAVTAEKVFFADALRWRPDLVLFVVMSEGPENRQAIKRMVDGFAAAGTQCVMFDSLWPAEWDLQPKTTDPVLSTTKLKVIDVKELLEASPDVGSFWSIDRVHTTEPWHVLMAREWFKYLAGVRAERLAGRQP
jgi:hypothetical protein